MPIHPEILRRLKENDPTLVELDLNRDFGASRGSFADKDIITLCDALKMNTSLQSMELKEHEISDEGAQALARTNLIRLNLTGNKIGVAGARAFASNKKLTTLNLYNNELGDAGAIIIAQNTSLISLNIGWNFIGDEGAEALSANRTITELHLDSNNIGDRGAQALASNNSLLVLGLKTNRITDSGVRGFANNHTLTELHLMDNKIADAGARSLAKNTKITTLGISGNPIGDSGVEALAASKTLRILHLYSHLITDVGASFLAQNDSLFALILGSSCIKSQSMQFFAHNTTLKILKLCGTVIDNAGLVALAKNNTLTKLLLLGHKASGAGLTALARNRNLISLSIVYANVDISFARALAQNNTLKHLALTVSGIDNKFIEELSMNRTLDSIEINESPGDKIGNSGALALAQMKLSSLAMCLHGVDDAVIPAVAKALSKNSTLRKLDLTLVRINVDSAEALSSSKTLISLTISRSSISSAAVQILTSNSMFVNLDLTGDMCDMAAQAFEKNSRLIWADLSRTTLSEFAWSKIQTKLVLNQQPTVHLIEACKANNLTKVSELLNKGVRPYGLFIQRKLHGNTLLHLAVKQNNQALLKLLFQYGAEIDKDSLNRDDMTYIDLAQFKSFDIPPAASAYSYTSSGSRTWQPHPFSIISPQDLQKGQRLGVGTFGTVYKGTYRGATVAIKELSYQAVDETAKRNFQKEADLLANLNHDNIIGYRGVVLDPRTLVMEFAECGSLFSLLQSNEQISERERFRFAYEIALAIAYLHGCNPEVVHCDLKSPNVLLGKDRKVKVSDFGLSKTKHNASSKSIDTIRGTPTHMAPELFDAGDDNSGDTKITPKIDIYSFAILLWELATRQIPFPGKNQMQIMFMICSGRRPPEPTNANPAFKALLVRCWAQNPNDRPTADEVVGALRVHQQEAAGSSSSRVPVTPSGLMSMGSGKW